MSTTRYKEQTQNPSDTLGQNYDFTMEQPLLNYYTTKTQLNGERLSH